MQSRKCPSLALVALLISTSSMADDPTSPSFARFPRNVTEFDQLFEQVKDWGHWGVDDQLGAANWINEAKRKQALALARLGKTVSMSHPYLTASAAQEGADPFEGNGVPFEHIMERDYRTDIYKFSYHSFIHTHLDGLCHVPYKGHDWNGYPTEEVNTASGCKKLGVENLRNGVLTRGILIDIPRLRNLPYLEPGTPVFVEDIEAWEKKTGLKISPGDAIFLRTGRWARWAQLGPWALSQHEAGFHASIAPWLKKRGVAFIGSDGGLDVLPSMVDGAPGEPLHALALTALGIAILDNHDLEEVGEVAARLKRWEFLFITAPLVVTGGTGSPVNSLAVF